uniref:Carboxylic ester hydrolase n=1 Tax=Branchiostoma floridae TaxID=7739 RepID=C3XX29_BRAFL|eukprot:XP_002611279.1 hypothetical protein BRAFLDRAFT_210697 [Branchiostoma floridae]
MVWLHGGGLIGGSGDTYPAEIPTAFHNVVMVTVNYRLSNLGFMPTLDDDSPGNFGLVDVMKSLEWVQGNIRNFGGDPDRVTIFGESGGAWAVSLLVMSPMATGLFHRAISQSGVAGVQIVVGGSFLPESPWDMMHKKQVNKVDYLLGTNNDEFGFCMPTLSESTSTSSKTHTSYFTTRPARVRADHADDLWYLFGVPLMRDENAAWKYNFSEEERELSLDMMAYWVNFAANGGAARMRDLAKWPRHTPSGQEYLRLNVTSSADVRLRESRMKFWNEEVPRLMGKKIRTARPDEL